MTHGDVVSGQPHPQQGWDMEKRAGCCGVERSSERLQLIQRAEAEVVTLELHGSRGKL